MIKSDYLTEVFKKLIVQIFVFLCIVISLCVYFNFDSFSFNIGLFVKLLISLIIAFLFYFLTKKYYYNIKNFLEKNTNKKLLVFLLILFSIQIVICFYGIFVAGWDVDFIAKGAIIYNNPVDPFRYEVSSYFSKYPNNLFILWVTYNTLKISNHIGAILSLNPYHITVFFVVCMLSFLNTLTGFLTFKTVQDFTKNNVISSIALMVYAVFIGTSFWILIPYTDSMGLIFPLLMFRIYQVYKNKNNKTNKTIFLNWLVIGFVFYFGFRSKPQSAVMFIAIIIIELLNYIKNIKNYGVLLLKISSCFISILVASMIFNGLMVKSIGVILDKEQEFGMTHFAMMGLNEDSTGGYFFYDVLYSKSFPNQKERAKGNIKVITERINDYGAEGLLKFLAKKTYKNFSDGTFAWGKEGDFYVESIPNSSKVIGPLIKSFYYNGKGEFYGNNYKIHENVKNGVWLILLFGLPFSTIFYKRNKDDQTLIVLHLSLIGITLFLTLFESRARYLYTFSPIFLIVGLLGINEFFKITRLVK